MIRADDLALFVAASTALALVPGPDNLFVLAQSALHGVRAGLLVTLGLCTGLVVHGTAVALGVAALFRDSALAFNALKIAGAGYLLWLAWQAYASAASNPVPLADAPTLPDGRALYLRGIVMNVSNPKVAIFFLAFLPQFADPARGSVPAQIALLALAFMLSALIVFSLIAWTAGRLGAWLRRTPRAQLHMNRAAAAVFVLLALRLLFSTQD